MDTQKKETIDKLYFIRSLLSKVSQHSEYLKLLDEKRNEVNSRKFEPKFEKKELTQEEIDAKEKRIWEIEFESEYLRKRLNMHEGSLSYNEDNVEKLTSLLNDPKTLKKHINSNNLYNSILILISLTISFALFMWWDYNNYALWYGVLFFAVSITALIFSIIRLRKFTSKERITHELNYSKEVIPIRKKEVENTKNNLQKLEEEKEKLNPSKHSLDKLIEIEYKLFLENQRKESEEIHQKQITRIKLAEPIYKLALNESNNIIDERDWENLDIIIYELETGRADSLKEALQQTDLLIRHNEIKQAIGKATEAICVTIQQSISEISFSIERNMLRIHDDFISLSDDQRRIQESLQNVVSAQELSNALKEKANVSSAQLAADVKRLRELEDYKFYRS